MRVNYISLTLSVGIGLIIWFLIPPPQGVSINAWHMLALFVGTILAIITKAMPIGAVAIIAITLVAITGVTASSPKASIKNALSGFSSPLIWLIGMAIIISRALIKTGLGKRIGYYFISLFGKKSIGIGYALSFSELTIAPITPSNTARGGGIIHPIMKSIATSLNSKVEDNTQNKIGKYLALVNYHTNPITSAMFITATAPNPLIVKFIHDITGIQVSWMMWFLAAFLPGIVCLLLLPIIMFYLSPPEIKETPNAQSFAKEELKKLGKFKKEEYIMVGVFILLLLLWAGVPAMIFGKEFALHSATVAFLGVSILLLTNVLTWEDVLKEKAAWDTIIWFSALIMMASYLKKLGLTDWFANYMQHLIANLGVSWPIAAIILTLIYLYAHYFFASTTAQITALYAVFLSTGISLGAPPLFMAFLLAGASSIMMTLTHYATGTSPIIFGSGYVSLKEWWKIGFIMSVIYISIWIVLGAIWWKILGYY